MKFLNHSLFITFSVIIFASCSQKHNIEASIIGLGNDTIFVEYVPLSQFAKMEAPILDTIISTQGKFHYDMPSDEPIMLFLFPKKGEFKRMRGNAYRPMQKHIVLLLKPEDKISINGQLKDYYLEYESYGSKFNEQFSQLEKTYIEETSQAVFIELQIDTLSSKKGNRELINSLFKKRNDINDIARRKKLEYIKNNLDKELSAYLLTGQRLDSLGKYYENLNGNIKNGIFKDMLESYHLRYQKYVKVREAEENIIEGKTAPDFCLKLLSGSDFTLSSINDKYIVLDFWGSWCGWCIKGFPKMKEYYKKYKSQIEIIGIACNDTEDKWEKSVQKHELDWLHVINDKDIDKDVSVMYGITGYPTKIILDKDRNIIAKFDGESEDFYKKLDELMKN